MIRVLHPGPPPWIDVVAPSEEELSGIARQYGIHPTAVQDCLEPSHLPKYEKTDGTRFFILRHADESAYRLRDSDTIQELTRKIAIFSNDRLLLVVHRDEQRFLSQIQEKWAKAEGLESGQWTAVIIEILREVILSYEKPLADAEDAFEVFELKLLNQLTELNLLEELYFLKRKVAVYRRMLRLNSEVLFRVDGPFPKVSPLVQDLREEAERVLAHAEELLEDLNHLLGMHISLASHRTNEIMRVLTLFSVFFMPLTFIVGVYGMNFEWMPELKMKYGYPALWAAMLGLSGLILVWFRRKGWWKG